MAQRNSIWPSPLNLEDPSTVTQELYVSVIIRLQTISGYNLYSAHHSKKDEKSTECLGTFPTSNVAYFENTDSRNDVYIGHRGCIWDFSVRISVIAKLLRTPAGN